jgi:hypothetical protein
MVSYGGASAGTIFGTPVSGTNMLWASGGSLFAIGDTGSAPVTLNTGNTERIRIDSKGNVGVGTSSPIGKFAIYASAGDTINSNILFTVASSTNTATTTFLSMNNVGSTTIGGGSQVTGLTINGGATTTGNLLVSGNATSTNFFATTASTSNLFFSNGRGTTSAFAISSIVSGILSTNANGSIISTTISSPLTFASNALGIQVGTGAQNGYLASSDWTIFNNKVGSTSIDTSSELGALITDETGAGGVLVFNSSPTFTTQITTPSVTNAGTLALSATGANIITGSTNGSERFRIDSTGNFGVGTTSPGTRLGVSGNAVIAGEVTGRVFSATSTATASIFPYASSTAFTASGFAYFANTGGTAVGVGTATPWTGSKLQVAADGNQFNPQILISGSTDARKQLQLGYDVTNNFGMIQSIQNGVVYTPLSINPGGGNVGIGTTTPTNLLSVGNVGQAGSSFYKIAADTIGVNSSLYSYNLLCAGNASGTCTDPSGGVVIASSSSNLYGNTYLTGSGNSYFNGGNVGVGTTTPWRKLGITGTVAISGLTSATNKNAVCIDTTTKELVDSGNTTCVTSSARFKENIIEYAPVTALATITKLNLVTFKYIEGINNPNRDWDGNLIGLIAEDVAKVEPRLVEYESSTTTPEGRIPRGLHFESLGILALGGVQAIDTKIEDLATTTYIATLDPLSFIARFFAGLKTRLIAWFSDAGNGIGDFIAGRLRTKELCVGDGSGAETCVTKAQLDSLLASAASGAGSGGAGGSGGGSPPAPPSNEPPVITVNGNSTSTISVGDSYIDLGATISDDHDQNLGLHFSVNGIDVPDVTLDTSTSTTYTIVYSATDTGGLTGYATRTVDVVQP